MKNTGKDSQIQQEHPLHRYAVIVSKEFVRNAQIEEEGEWSSVKEVDVVLGIYPAPSAAEAVSKAALENHLSGEMLAAYRLAPEAEIAYTDAYNNEYTKEDIHDLAMCWVSHRDEFQHLTHEQRVTMCGRVEAYLLSVATGYHPYTYLDSADHEDFDCFFTDTRLPRTAA